MSERKKLNQLRQYAKPRLVAYGTLADLTRAVGNMADKDGGTGNTSRKSA